MTSQTQTRPCSHPARSWLCSQKAQIDAFDPTDMRRLKCKTKYELNIIWNPLKARGGGFSTFLKLAQKVWWEVWMLRAPETRGEKKKPPCNLKNLRLKMAKRRFISLPYYNPILEIHWGHEKGTRLALLQKWACLWLLLISGFVCAATGSSYGFAGDPQAFCVISRSGFCLAPEAICCRTPFVPPFHARFGRRSRITGNTAITRTPLLVSPATTVSTRDKGRHWIPTKSNQSLTKYALFFH